MHLHRGHVRPLQANILVQLQQATGSELQPSPFFPSRPGLENRQPDFLEEISKAESPSKEQIRPWSSPSATAWLLTPQQTEQMQTIANCCAGRSGTKNADRKLKNGAARCGTCPEKRRPAACLFFFWRGCHAEERANNRSKPRPPCPHHRLPPLFAPGPGLNSLLSTREFSS